MKKILFLTEASFLSTGYSTYGREIMKRLYSTGKYKIAELGCYGHVAPLQNEIDNYIRLFGPPRMFDIPWTYYGNLPSESKEENDLYNSNMTNQYGEWRFERTCLDFQPDVVCDFRDFWMHEYVLRSPLRRFFKFAVMPTVDSAPLQEQWLYAYSSADAVFSYSEFGKQTLLDGTNNNINFRGIASPSADKEIFKPVKDKFNHRSMMGFEDDIKIIGTVMRNQGRKLYPDLFEVFSKISKEVPNCYLYCHTCYPDIGWDIPYFLKYFDIGNKVLFTYKCFECGAIIPSFFSDSVKTCPHCNNISCKMPNTQNGISPVDLAAIYNCFDLYIQYANCMPAGEKVFVNNSWKNIEDVKIGDIAFTHKGNNKVVKNTFKKYYNDNIYEIKVCGDFDTSKFTKEHPIYSIIKTDKNKKSLREQIGDRIRNGYKIQEISFNECYKLKNGDLIAYRIDDEVIDYSRIKCYNIDEDFCKFIGIFAGDGSCDKQGGIVKITCNLNEIETHNICNKVLNTIDKVRYRNYKNRHAKDIYISDSYTNKIFLNWFCKHENKKLPDWTDKLPINKQKFIIQGLMMSDGHYNEEHNVTIYSTISITLARQLKNLLRRCRINFNCRKVKKSGKRKPQYRFEITNNCKIGDFECNTRKSTNNIYIDNYHLMQIKSIKTESFDGFVYNFEVEDDNSYLNFVGNSHNCEGYGIPQCEAAFCGVPVAAVDYSAMSSILNDIDGIRLPVQRMFWDTGTNAQRAFPDNNKAADIIIEHLKMPVFSLLKMGNSHRIKALQAYDYDKSAKLWSDYFDSVEPSNWNDKNANIQEPELDKIPSNIPNNEFVNWCLVKILKEPERINSYEAMKWLKDLNYGEAIKGTSEIIFNEASFITNNQRYMSFTRKDFINNLIRIAEKRNYYEKLRLGLINEPKPYWIIRKKEGV